MCALKGDPQPLGIEPGLPLNPGKGFSRDAKVRLGAFLCIASVALAVSDDPANPNKFSLTRPDCLLIRDLPPDTLSSTFGPRTQSGASSRGTGLWGERALRTGRSELIGVVSLDDRGEFEFGTRNTRGPWLRESGGSGLGTGGRPGTVGTAFFSP